ncbi:MAG: hypothetical protein K2O18_10290 [Oscillospiraceae bacterium]|nr:hypothetical protein [Oscillospiraceae bacterium]
MSNLEWEAKFTQLLLALNEDQRQTALDFARMMVACNMLCGILDQEHITEG